MGLALSIFPSHLSASLLDCYGIVVCFFLWSSLVAECWVHDPRRLLSWLADVGVQCQVVDWVRPLLVVRVWFECPVRCHPGFQALVRCHFRFRHTGSFVSISVASEALDLRAPAFRMALWPASSACVLGAVSHNMLSTQTSVTHLCLSVV